MVQQNKPWVLVTGGSRGIGRGIVRSLFDQYRVVLTYKSRKEEADGLVDELRASGGDVHAFQCDGTDPDQVGEFATHCVNEFGAPYAVINNAGITRDSLMFSMQEAAWRDVVSANLDSVFRMVRAFLPAMLEERRGAILLMSSVTAVKGNAGQTNYAATKAAMIGMAKSLALELARFDLRVNAIAPGLIDTEMAESMPEKDRKRLASGIPLRRLGKVAEVAGLVRYLLSEDASYITGQTIVIDGGLSA